MTKAIVPIVLLMIIMAIYFVGPKVAEPHYDKTWNDFSLTTKNVGEYVINHESAIKIKPDNEARIIWYNDSIKNKTEYCLLYLHGFSASWYEGNPTHIHIAQKLKANLYLSRLAGHGLQDPDAFLQMTPDNLYETAKEALAVAHALDKKVIIMSTSTGGTLSLKLAADFPDKIQGLIMLSPNIRINNSAAFLLDKHWGITVARQTAGGSLYRNLGPGLPAEEKYWYRKYRWEGTVYLQKLISTTMKKAVFQKVTQPVFVGYYYRDEEHQDPVVKVSAILKMFDELGTSAEQKEKVAFPNANTHVIGCNDFSGCSLEVENVIAKFVLKHFTNR